MGSEPTLVAAPTRMSLREVVPLDVLRPLRLTLASAYLVGYLWWLRFKGLPVDRISVAISVGMFLVCAFVGRSWRTWAVLLFDCVCYSAMWLAYERTRGAADEGISVLGLFRIKFPLQVTTMRDVDRLLFFGHDPNVVMQRHLMTPLVVRWYDVVLSTTYMTHFVFPVVVMAVLWVASHRQWVRFMKRFATVLAIACVMFVLLPTAPPWMLASKNYHLLPPLRRATGNGFVHIGFHGFAADYKVQLSNGNPVAAMPSLHASFALIVPAFFLPWVRWKWLKALLLTFPVIMAVALVYFAEHWVIDALVGWMITGASFLFWHRAEQWLRERRATRARAAFAEVPA